MKKLYIHIGMPKTGSSAIQAFFACNNDKLNTVDFCYPWHPGFGQAFQTSAGNATSLHHCIMDNNFVELRDKINNLPQKNIILSSEILFHTARLHPESFAKALNGYNVKIICYVRKIDDLVDSCINQLVKNHGLVNYDDIDTIINDHDYATTLINLSKYINKDNIDVRIYDRSKFTNNDIYEDILDACDLNKLISKNEMVEPEKSINPSLVPEAFQLRQILNSISFENENTQSKYTFNSILAHYSVGVKKYKFSILSLIQREKIFEIYKEREISLNKLFFGADKRIFDEITLVEKPEVTKKELSDVLYFVYKHDSLLLLSIAKYANESNSSEYCDLLNNVIEDYLIPKLTTNERLNLIPIIKEPTRVVIPFNFAYMTHSFSDHAKLEDSIFSNRINSIGSDPFFSFKRLKINNKTSAHIIVTLHSTIECTSQLHFQTVSEPYYGKNKFQLVKVKPGFNEVKFFIESEDFNGNFRFDPIMKEGIIDIYSVIFYLF